MTIREALEELGVERVGMAMAAFDDPPGNDEEPWIKCPIARAFGAPGMLWRGMLNIARHPAAATEWHAALYLRTAVEVVETVADVFDEQPDQLREACIQFLAEHGSHPEPARFVCAEEQEVSAQ